MPHCADTAPAVTPNVSDDADTEDPADVADVTDADVYEQIANNAMAYPEQAALAEEPANPCSNKSHIPPQHHLFNVMVGICNLFCN
jgi:hypothetical protein